MKQIIAAIDFSEVSDAVVKHAASMAKAYSASLVLLHVAAPNPDFVGLEAGPQFIRDGRADELRTEHNKLQQKAQDLRDQGINTKASLIQGPTTDTILERVEHLDADLLILGSHGHGAVYRALMGSVSEGVLHRATIPVFIVPARRAISKT